MRTHLINAKVTCGVIAYFQLPRYPPPPHNQHHNLYTLVADISFQLIKGYGYETKPSATLPEGFDNGIFLYSRLPELNKQRAYTVL